MLALMYRYSTTATKIQANKETDLVLVVTSQPQLHHPTLGN